MSAEPVKIQLQDPTGWNSPVQLHVSAMEFRDGVRPYASLQAHGDIINLSAPQVAQLMLQLGAWLESMETYT